MPKRLNKKGENIALEPNLFRKLIGFDIPICLRICAGTDGSVTYLLEIMTLGAVVVNTLSQEVVQADGWMAGILGISEGERVNDRRVSLSAGGIEYVQARSLTPFSKMPAGVENDLMRADIPIGKILQKWKIESRRVIDSIELENVDGSVPELVRRYRIIHGDTTLMWIEERFIADERWNL